MAQPNSSPAPGGVAAPAGTNWLVLLGRFVSCGVLSVALGLAWKFTAAPGRLGVSSALAGIAVLLLGFMLGGIGWYAHDLRQSRRQPQLTDNDRVAFSLIVFALMPLLVLVLVLLVWATVRLISS